MAITDKVVSLKARREAKLIAENLEEGVFYQSLIENIPEVQGKEEISYFMVVYSLPAEDFEDYDSEETEVITVVKDKAVGEFKSLEGKEVERYEIYDFNTDDIHVMYRIPYRPPRRRPLKDNPGV
jgi:hypothetical protein